MKHDAPNAGALHSNDICQDVEVRLAKEKTLKKMEGGLLLGNVSKLFSMFGGPLLGAGLLGLIGFMGSSPNIMPIAIGVTVLGAAMQLSSFAIDYFASKTNQESYFDQGEAIAQSNARHLVKELKKNNMCFSQQPDDESPCRKDGKSWVQTVSNPAQEEIQRIM